MTQKILIAEDDSQVANVLWEILTTRGHDVAWAPDGAVALQRAVQEGFDAAVLDIHLPGMNGIAVAERLRDRKPEMKIVLTSGMITESTKQAAAGLKNVTLLGKPVNADELAAALAEPAPPAPATDVIVVEDYDSLRHLISGVLESEGFNVAAVADGDAAIREAARRRAKIAVVDLHVPGPHGAELIRRLLEVDPTLYVFMMTGEATHPEVSLGYRAGARALIRKPFRAAALLAALKGREREIDEYRKAATEKERVESLPGWKRAVHETRTFVKQAQKGQHRAKITHGIVLAAVFVVSLTIGWAIDAVRGANWEDVPHDSPASVEKQFIPIVIMHDEKGAGPSKPFEERPDFGLSPESRLRAIETNRQPIGSPPSSMSDADLRRMIEIVARERR